jgi:hypothetical protein
VNQNNPFAPPVQEYDFVSAYPSDIAPRPYDNKRLAWNGNAMTALRLNACYGKPPTRTMRKWERAHRMSERRCPYCLASRHYLTLYGWRMHIKESHKGTTR